MRIVIDVDVSQVKLPDYNYTYDGLIEELGFDEANKYIWKKHKVGLDGLADNYDREFTEPVSQRTQAKFKRQLLEKIQDDIKEMIRIYKGGDLGEEDFEMMNLDDAINSAGEKFYTEPEDLSWDLYGDVEIKVVEKKK